MALKRNERYPGRFANPSTAHPQGAFQNRTSPTSQDGSYLEADWANDIDGFFARIINVAGITLNGTVDDGTASQLYDALLTAMPGRRIAPPRTITASGTYTPTAGTKAIRVRGVGGGGAGGGVGASSSTTMRGGGGGGAGAYGELWLTSVPSSVAVTIGAGGTGVSGNAGNSGGTTSFGSLLTLPGGVGGELGIQATGAARTAGGGSMSSTPTGASYSVRGQAGGDALAISAQTVQAGNGGSNPLGYGAATFIATSTTGTAFSNVGVISSGNGAGGGGATCGIGGAANAGGAGSIGILIIEEFS